MRLNKPLSRVYFCLSVGSSLCLRSVCPSLSSPGSALDCAGGQRTRGQQRRVGPEAGVSVARTAIGGSVSGQWHQVSGERRREGESVSTDIAHWSRGHD